MSEEPRTQVHTLYTMLGIGSHVSPQGSTCYWWGTRQAPVTWSSSSCVMGMLAAALPRLPPGLCLIRLESCLNLSLHMQVQPTRDTHGSLMSTTLNAWCASCCSTYCSLHKYDIPRHNPAQSGWETHEHLFYYDDLAEIIQTYRSTYEDPILPQVKPPPVYLHCRASWEGQYYRRATPPKQHFSFF